MSDPLVLKVRDGLARCIWYAHANNKAYDQRPDDKYLAVLVLAHVLLVDVQRVCIHREEREDVVIGFGNSLTRPVFVYVAGREFLKVAAVFVFAVVDQGTTP